MTKFSSILFLKEVLTSLGVYLIKSIGVEENSHHDSSPHCSCANSGIVSSLWKVTFHKNHLRLLFWAGITGLLLPSSAEILSLLQKRIQATAQVILTPSWRMFVFCEQSSIEIIHHYKRSWSKEVSLGKTGTEKVLKKTSRYLNLKIKFHCNCIIPQPGELLGESPPVSHFCQSCGRSINTGEEQVTQDMTTFRRSK